MPFDSSRGAPTVAARMRALLGPNGEYWCKGRMTNRVNGVWSACLHGAFLAATTYDDDISRLANTDVKAVAVVDMHYFRFLQAAVQERWHVTNSPSSFNDHAFTTFADIRAILDDMERRELAERAKELEHAV